MVIVTINAHYMDGLGYQDYYLCKEFIKMGHTVHQLASDRHFPFPDYDNTVRHIIGPRIVGPGVFKSEFNMDIHRLETSFVLLGKIWMKGIQKKLDELKPDLIFCHGVFNIYSYRIALYASRKNVPVVYDDHTTSNCRNNSGYVLMMYRLFSKLVTPLITRTAVKIVAISDSVLDFLKNDLKFNQKLETIYLGADTGIFFPSHQERIITRRELGIDDDTILILYTGKIYKEKMLDQIPAALKLIDLRGKKVKVLFVGPLAGNFKDAFKEILSDPVAEMLYHKSVPPAELRKYYNAADICCWPAHATGSTVDASACGCPVICNAIMSERISYGNGLGVSEGDTLGLKLALEQLIFDDEKRRQMGILGVAYVREKLSWNALAKQFLVLN